MQNMTWDHYLIAIFLLVFLNTDSWIKLKVYLSDSTLLRPMLLRTSMHFCELAAASLASVCTPPTQALCPFSALPLELKGTSLPWDFGPNYVTCFSQWCVNRHDHAPPLNIGLKRHHVFLLTFSCCCLHQETGSGGNTARPAWAWPTARTLTQLDLQLEAKLPRWTQPRAAHL